jgi:hypothetical protein
MDDCRRIYFLQVPLVVYRINQEIEYNIKIISILLLCVTVNLRKKSHFSVYDILKDFFIVILKFKAKIL